MTLNELMKANITRAQKWHNGDMNEWSTLEWAAAMAGEAGKACNAAKKLKRLECKIASINEPGRHYEDVEDAKEEVALEVAGTIIYAILLAARIGITDIEELIRYKFNKTSIKYDFEDRL